MPFKVHLIIICVIIVFTYIILQVMNSRPEPQAVAPTEEDSPYIISIIHASWGLNCTDGYSGSPTPAGSFVSGPKKLREDNVLSKISAVCNGKKSCGFKVDAETLGEDPAPDCGYKELKMEYRCFEFDRPWIIQSADVEIAIDCEKLHGAKKN